jgi:very-short-patch-repair endonuclease
MGGEPVVTPRDIAPPPPPSGAGAGGGGRSNAQAPNASARPPSVASGDTSPARGEDARSRKLGHGWAPQPEARARQKDRTRTKLRAQRLRKELTPSEKKLRDLLRTIEGAHFRKEVAVGDYVFDFGWYSARLLIEIDGSIHARADVQANDKAKAIHAIANGFRVLRFENNDVWDRPAWVVAQVRDALNAVASDRPPPLTPPREGAGDE